MNQLGYLLLSTPRFLDYDAYHWQVKCHPYYFVNDRVKRVALGYNTTDLCLVLRRRASISSCFQGRVDSFIQQRIPETLT